MLRNNQNLQIQPYGLGVKVALETNYGDKAFLITKYVEYPGDDQRYIMAIESAVIYLQKKTENAEF